MRLDQIESTLNRKPKTPIHVRQRSGNCLASCSPDISFRTTNIIQSFATVRSLPREFCRPFS